MWAVVTAVLAAVVAAWLLLVLLLWRARLDRTAAADALLLIPDTARLVRRLAFDRSLPLVDRAPVWMLLVYLASPIDVVPDFLPGIGYADDVVLAALVLRRLVRRAGSAKVREHWPGTEERLARLERLLRLDA
jgi:uncharacterized membrane protein YkvA (DUF1232 family)